MLNTFGIPMNREEVISFILETIKKSPYGYMKILKSKRSEIEQHFTLVTDSFKENLYLLVHGIKEIPLCQVCKEKKKVFFDFKKGYGKTCSKLCSAKLGGEANKRKLSKITLEEKRKIEEKRINTNQLLYGVNYPLQREESKKKFKQTCKERYGDSHFMKNEYFYEHYKSKIKEKYGVEFYFQTEESKSRSSILIHQKHSNNFFKNYFFQRYGVENYYQTEEGLRKQLRERNCEFLFETIEQYLDGRTYLEIANQFNITDHMIKKIILFKGIDYTPIKYESSFEREIKEFLLKHISPQDMIFNDRTILNGLELDVLIPNKNLAIECNGVYYHTDQFKEPEYHKQKYEMCRALNILLIQIDDIDYYKNKEKWQYFILSKLNNNMKTVYARNCEIKEVSSQDAKVFIENNHLQGYANSRFKFGLYDNKSNELVAISTFAKPRFSQKYDYELVRFCSKRGIRVLGGFSKLISHFYKNVMKKDETCVSYANCFWSNGDVYEKTGFSFVRTTSPNYVWSDGKTKLSKYQSQKKKLFEKYGDIVKTEEDFMRNVLRMNRYYDAGNRIYVLKKGEI